jgi:hypothetical protein
MKVRAAAFQLSLTAVIQLSDWVPPIVIFGMNANFAQVIERASMSPDQKTREDNERMLLEAMVRDYQNFMFECMKIFLNPGMNKATRLATVQVMIIAMRECEVGSGHAGQRQALLAPAGAEVRPRPQGRNPIDAERQGPQHYGGQLRCRR